jgi:hypothetical protein
MADLLHVLLLLSSAHPPDPAEEIARHAAECERAGSTVVATTRGLRGLTRRRSVVAFYGDSGGFDNDLLGFGIFNGYGLTNTARGKAMLGRSDALYGRYGKPRSTKGAIELIEFHAFPKGTPISVLKGRLVGSGELLTRESLPERQQRLEVYFTRSGDVT